MAVIPRHLEPLITRRSTALAAVLVGGAGLVTAAPALGGISPIISDITPSSGTTAGGTPVVIIGQYLNACGGYIGVRFGGVAATQVQSISSGEMRAVTPAFGTPGPVTVEVRCQMSSWRANGFTYVTPPPDPTPDPSPDPAAPSPPPTSTSTATPGALAPAPSISGIAPGGASTIGGQIVVVGGAHFTGATAVTFTGQAGTVGARSFTVPSDDRLLVTVPALTAGVWTVTVTTPGGTASRTGFLVVAQPTAAPGGGTSQAATSGPAGSGTFTTWLRVGQGIDAIGPRPRYTLGTSAASREAGLAGGTACLRSAITGTPPRVRITCPVSPMLRAALADGSARVSIRMTARVKGSTAVIPLQPVPVTVRAPVRRLAVTG